MTYPTDEETFPTRTSPKFIRQGHLNTIQAFLKRIQDFLGYGGRLHDETGLVMPVGSIISYAGFPAPSGWLRCDGKFYDPNNSLYLELYNIIGYQYGKDNSNYFSVPDLRYYILRGYGGISDENFSPSDVSTGNDTIDLGSTEFTRHCIPVRFTTTGGLPAPLIVDTTYYIIGHNTGVIKIADTRANAILETQINITTQGTGTHTIKAHYEVDRSARLPLSYGGNSGDNVGSYQDDEFKSHNHPPDPTLSGFAGTRIGAANWKYGGDVLQRYASETGYRGGSETRPKNVNVNYIIKR